MNRLCDRLIRWLEFAMAAGLLMIAATVIVQVILSSCFNSSITGANEIVTKLFVYLTAVGAAVAVGHGEHIAITVAVEKLPPAFQRAIQKLTLIMIGVLNVVVVAFSVHWINVTGHYLMPTTQLPRIVAQLSIPVGSGMATAFCVAQLFAAQPNAGLSGSDGEASRE